VAAWMSVTTNSTSILIPGCLQRSMDIGTQLRPI
jgi:hypothetical protein